MDHITLDHILLYFQIWIVSYFKIQGLSLPPSLEENVVRASFTASTTPGLEGLTFQWEKWTNGKPMT